MVIKTKGAKKSTDVVSWSDVFFFSKDDSINKDILYHDKILSDFSNNIYLIFCNTKTDFELWDALKYKYCTEEKSLKMYLIDNWLDFQMVDEKYISDQIHEFENLFMIWKLREWNLIK